jgi:hypothetical protein
VVAKLASGATDSLPDVLRIELSGKFEDKEGAFSISISVVAKKPNVGVGNNGRANRRKQGGTF